ncbi:MAG TPA: hypothetical protein VF589_08890 [Allosphingosinicella sp.]|jgi:hypothetical protein
MSKSSDSNKSNTVNSGGAPKPTQEERDREFADITGNVRLKGEDPSPDDRGETTSREPAPAIDIDNS